MKKITFLLILLFIGKSAIAQCWESASAGYSHVIAIADDGTLWSWGMNHFGELGDGTINNFQDTPVQVSNDTDWKIVSAGSGPTTFNLAIKDNGTLWAWGNNAYGQVGDGTFVNKLLPVQIGTDTNWKEVSAGYSHSLAVKTDGTLWSWGDSNYFALGYGDGYGTDYNRNTPTQIGTLNTWASVSAGDRYSLALKANGTVWGWGYNSGNPIGNNGSGTYVMTPQQRSYNNTNVRAISAGKSFSYDVKNSNLLVTWGSGVYGQTGGTTCAGCPVYNVTAFDCGADTAAIIKTNGTLWYTGKKLGYTAPTVQYTSEFLQLGDTANNWRSVSVGNQSGAAIKNDGTLYTWGWNFYGELGIGTSGPNADSQTLVSVLCPQFLGNKQITAHSFSVYPNPAEDILYIKNTSLSKTEKIVVLNTLGMPVVSTNSETVNISGLPAGIYIVQIYYNGGSISQKFIKK